MKKVYLLAKFKKRFFWIALVSTIVFMSLLILNLVYFNKTNFKENTFREIAYIAVGVNALIYGTSFWIQYYYTKKPIISYSDTDFYIHKRNLYSKEWHFKREDIQAKLLVTGDIGIQVEENTYEVFKKSILDKDFNDLLDYLNIK